MGADAPRYPARYRSTAGSIVTVPRWGVSEIDWDWFEEGACCDARPTFDDDPAEPFIIAECECCGTEHIPVFRCEPVTRNPHIDPPEALHD